jgi:hypothetical protein
MNIRQFLNVFDRLRKVEKEVEFLKNELSVTRKYLVPELKSKIQMVEHSLEMHKLADNFKGDFK